MRDENSIGRNALGGRPKSFEIQTRHVVIVPLKGHIARSKANGPSVAARRQDYFPKSAMEGVLGRDLTPFFPLAEDISVFDQMSEEFRPWIFRLKKVLARVFRLAAPSTKRSLYSKSRNRDVAERMSLAGDLDRTDLYEIIQHISSRALELQDS